MRPTLEHTYAEAVPALSTPWAAAQWPEPRLALLNEPLADELGLDVAWLRSDDGVRWLVGDGVDGTVAQAYAGHQFGHFSGVLGDGRALLLGELVTPDGRRVDLHLKGSGRTPFSRGGDGMAALGPMLREFVVSEALHALRIPTTRSLAVVTTGATVQRSAPLPGAVLCRVAASHLRVGTFQLAAALAHSASRDDATLRALADHAIARHHRSARDADDPYLALLSGVATRHAELVAQWMLVGFVHGVMNTDNATISGETIDYGPCAFLDRYDPSACFSSIDHGGRYAYDQQPAVAVWNLARFAETLLPLMSGTDDARVARAQDVLTAMRQTHTDAFDLGLAHKLGQDVDLDDLTDADRAHNRATLAARAAEGADFTASFADIEPARDAPNPLVIPRNHALQQALDAAEDGDPHPVTALLEAVRHPGVEPADPTLKGPAPAGTGPFVSYCGT